MTKAAPHKKKSSNQENLINQGSENDMKQSGTLSLPKGWEMKKLGEVAEIEYGYTDKASSVGNYRYIRITDIDNEGLLSDNEKVYIKSISEAKPFLLNNGDLLMARIGATFAKVLFYKEFEPSIFASYLIRIKFKTQIDNKFYWYFSKSNDYWEQANKLSSGAAQPQFNGNALKQVLFPFPKSLPEQQRIVSILDKSVASIDKAKANAEQNLKNAKELFESYLQGLFEEKGDGWEECNLEENIKLIDYRGRTPDKKPSGVRLITAKNVKLGYLQLEPQEFIAEDNYENWMTRGIPNLGDVIFTTEAPLANVAQITTNEKLAFAQRIIVMQPDRKKLNPTFLKYMLLSAPIRKRIIERGTGATVVGIKSSLLKKVKIIFPKSLSHQRTIVHHLDTLHAETQKLVTVYQKKIADLDELKKSILQKAFSGELKTSRTV